MCEDLIDGENILNPEDLIGDIANLNLRGTIENINFMENYILDIFHKNNIRMGVRIRDYTNKDIEKLSTKLNQYEICQIKIAYNVVKVLYEHVWNINPIGVLPPIL